MSLYCASPGWGDGHVSSPPPMYHVEAAQSPWLPASPPGMAHYGMPQPGCYGGALPASPPVGARVLPYAEAGPHGARSLSPRGGVAVSKKFRVNYNGAVEDFRVSNRAEESALLRETVAAAFSLPSPLFTLKDSEGCNVVVSFTSIVDNAVYSLAIPGEHASGGLGVPSANASLITTVRRVAPAAVCAALAFSKNPPQEVPLQEAKRSVPVSKPSLDSSAGGSQRFSSVVSRPGASLRGAEKEKGQLKPQEKSARAVLIGIDYSQRGPAYRLKKSRVFEGGVKKMRSLIESRYDDPTIMEALEEEEDGGLLLKGAGGGTRREGIMRWAEWLVEGQAKHSIFYFIGHAAVMSVSGGQDEEVLLPSDFNTTPDNFNVVSVADLMEVFRRIDDPSRKVTVVLDCTYTASHLNLPCRIRLFRSGDADMIETCTDQDSPLLTSNADVSVITCSSMSPSRGGETIESTLTHALCAVLSSDGRSHSLSNESALVNVATYIRQHHATASISPLVLASRVLDFQSPFCL